MLCRLVYCLATVGAIVGSGVTICGAAEGDWVVLSDGLEAWQEPTGAWLIAGGARLDPENERRLAAEPGEGVLVNGPKGKTKDLVSKDEWGDVEVELEFMIPTRSNSGLKLQGLYEVQIVDSWQVRKPTAHHCGGIYPRAELKPRYHHIDDGFAPLANAAKRPGEWQTLSVVFRAPRFDGGGQKTANARFDRVLLNGTVIHEDLEVPTPTGHAWRRKEQPVGPLLLQADHGPVAFRNVRVRPLPACEGEAG